MKDRAFVIKSSRIFDGLEDTLIDGYILIENGKIVKLGTSSATFLENFAGTVIDAGDNTVLPGLIDCHVHTIFFSREEFSWGVNEKTVASSTLRGLINLSECIKHGVTTIRDCGSPHEGIFALKKASERGKILAPRMLVSGCAIRGTGGHAPTVSIEADGKVEVMKAVRRQIKNGAQWIKLMVTGGTATEGEKITDVQYSFEEIQSAIEEAHRKGVKVTAHLSNLAGIKLCLKAGMDCIEHGIELDDECIDMMKNNGTYLVNCICLTNREANATDADNIPAFVREKAKIVADKQIKSFKKAYRRGITIAAGTDSDYFSHPFGKSMHWELEWLVKIGMTPAEALKSATSVAARVLGADDKLGIIKEGYLADLLIVEGNPLEDISNISRVKKVIKDGVVITENLEMMP